MQKLVQIEMIKLKRTSDYLSVNCALGYLSSATEASKTNKRLNITHKTSITTAYFFGGFYCL